MFVIVCIERPAESGLVEDIEYLKVYGPYASVEEAEEACPEWSDKDDYDWSVEPLDHGGLLIAGQVMES